MDSSFTIKPTPGVAKTRALRDPVAVREAVDTDLIGDRAVAAAGERPGKDSGDKHGKPKDHEQHEPRAEHAPHDLVANPDSRDVIYRERDVRAREREHPDDALLAQRAYHRQTATEPEAAPAATDPHADIKA